MMSGALCVMIIEDEDSVRESLQWYLEDLGHKVIAKIAPAWGSGERGEELLSNLACVDVLIVDQHLPGALGLDYIRQIQAGGCKIAPSRMLLVSGDASSIDMDQARALGVTVVQKPMTFQWFSEWLTERAG